MKRATVTNSYTALVLSTGTIGRLLGGKFAHRSPRMQQRSMAVAWAEGIIRINKAQNKRVNNEFIIRESALDPQVTVADVEWHDVTDPVTLITKRLPKPNDMQLLATAYK